MLEIAALLLAASSPSSEPHAGKSARCDVWYRNAIAYQGPCEFALRAGGSFTLTFPQKAGDISQRRVGQISVQVGRDGIATVTDADSRWGHAIRSKKDQACWIGREFRVCAYG
jgi:hypothetical protein